MIDYWVDPTQSRKGVHVHDVRKDRTYISTGVGSKPYSFAITDDLYVHTANGPRAVGLEKWFSGLEGNLANLARQVHARIEPLTCLTADSFALTLMALIGLECRSAYNIRKIQAALENDAYLRGLVAYDSPVPAEQQVLENIVHQVNDRVIEYSAIDMIFISTPAATSFLLCDRPYFHDPSLEYRFIVLTNKSALGYKRSETHPGYQYREAPAGLVSEFNRLLALQARDWLVAESAAQLDEYKAVFDTQEWADGVAADHITFEPIRNLTEGWRISS